MFEQAIIFETYRVLQDIFSSTKDVNTCKEFLRDLKKWQNPIRSSRKFSFRKLTLCHLRYSVNVNGLYIITELSGVINLKSFYILSQLEQLIQANLRD